MRHRKVIYQYSSLAVWYLLNLLEAFFILIRIVLATSSYECFFSRLVTADDVAEIKINYVYYSGISYNICIVCRYSKWFAASPKLYVAFSTRFAII